MLNASAPQPAAKPPTAAAKPRSPKTPPRNGKADADGNSTQAHQVGPNQTVTVGPVQVDTATLRPYVDELIITQLCGRIFSARDFYETRQGICRLMPTITHELATWLPALAREVAPIAEHLAHTFTDQINGRTTKATVLTKTNSKSAYPRPARTRTRQPPQPKSRASCRDCGQPLHDQRAKLCPSCWPDTREALARSRASAGVAEIARRRADGDDPTQSPGARAKRSKSLVAQRADQRAWEEDGQCVSEMSYESEIQPGLSALTLSVLRAATGLSLSACSQIRSGRLRPHQRHWQALATVIDTANALPAGSATGD